MLQCLKELHCALDDAKLLRNLEARLVTMRKDFYTSSATFSYIFSWRDGAIAGGHRWSPCLRRILNIFGVCCAHVLRPCALVVWSLVRSVYLELLNYVLLCVLRFVWLSAFNCVWRSVVCRNLGGQILRHTCHSLATYSVS